MRVEVLSADTEKKVLLGEIPVESFSMLDLAGLNSVPAVLILSPGAASAYEADPFTFGKYIIIERDQFIFLTETGVDTLAILRPAGEGKIEVQGGNVDEWLTVDLNQGQKLGLSVVTDQEAHNDLARFWATAFVFEDKGKVK